MNHTYRTPLLQYHSVALFNSAMEVCRLPATPLNRTMLGWIFTAVVQMFCWQVAQTVQTGIGKRSAPLITGALPLPYASKKMG